MKERVGDYVRNFGTAEMTLSHTPVEMALHLASQFAMDLLRLIAGCAARKPAQCLGVFLFKSQQHFFRQGIGQAKRDKVGCTFAFDVRQIASRVDTAAKWVRRFGRNTGGA